MRTRQSVFFISALCSLFLSSAVFAQERGQRRGSGKMQQLVQRLGLDAEQIRQFKTIQAQKRQHVRPLKRALKDKRHEMRKLWQTDTPSRDALLAKQAEMDHIRHQLQSLRLDTRLAVHAMLSPEQRQAWVHLMNKRRGKRNKVHKRRSTLRDESHRAPHRGEPASPEMDGPDSVPYEEESF